MLDLKNTPPHFTGFGKSHKSINVITLIPASHLMYSTNSLSSTRIHTDTLEIKSLLRMMLLIGTKMLLTYFTNFLTYFTNYRKKTNRAVVFSHTPFPNILKCRDIR